MQNGDGKLEPLFYAKRQALRTLIGNIIQVILLKQFLNPAFFLVLAFSTNRASALRTAIAC